VLYGEESVFVDTYEYLRHHLVNSTCFLLPNSEHFGPIERPELLLQHVRKFLADSETVSATSGAVPALVEQQNEPQLGSLGNGDSA
jgi:hypothetical protein